MSNEDNTNKSPPRTLSFRESEFPGGSQDNIPLNITPELEKCNVTKIAREGTRIIMEYGLQAHDGQRFTRIIGFDIKPKGFSDTLESFDKVSRGTWGPSRITRLPDNIIEQTKIAFTNDVYYRRKLEFYKRKMEDDASPKIGERNFDDETAKNIEQEQRDQEEAYASSVSDLDYDEILGKLQPKEYPLLSVSSAIRRDPQRLRICGIIDVVRKLLKLNTKIIFTCINTKCSWHNQRQAVLLDTPIYSFEDLPIAFAPEYDQKGKVVKTSMQRYQDMVICPGCQNERRARFDSQRYENAKIIELKNLSVDNKLVAANTTLNLEHLRVFVTGKHTLSVGLGEEVEIIGDLYVVSPLWSSSRLGGRSTGGGTGEPILYARKMKYTKRERELTIDEDDIKAFDRFASIAKCPKCKRIGYHIKVAVKDEHGNDIYDIKKDKDDNEINVRRLQECSDLIERQISLASPQIYGHEDVKLGLLLLAVGAAPSQKQNWYNRHWLNAGLFGDRGTAKTEMAEDAANWVPGSQITSGQHSTGKGIVAVAEREGDNGAFLRTGAATLANGAICLVDEIGTMSFEDQAQFLTLMEKGYFDFNKMGIRQRINSKTSFIVTANPIGKGDWTDSNIINKDELPLKGQLLDRLDLFSIFRRPRTAHEIREHAVNRVRLAKMHFRKTKDGKVDSIFLRKYLYSIRSDPAFDTLEFENSELQDNLCAFWTDLSISMAENESTSDRGFQSIYRMASAFARLMRKKRIDNVVVEYTIKCLRNMYEKHGAQIAAPINYKDIAYLGICQVAKELYQSQYWIEGQAEELIQISFNDAAETASKRDEKIAQYLGHNFRSGNSRSVRNLKELLREEREYDGGKIKVVSKDKYAPLKFTWIPNEQPKEEGGK